MVCPLKISLAELIPPINKWRPIFPLCFNLFGELSNTGFLKKSDLNCMIREYGPPTLFLTFSCAEYDSPDIASYLHKVSDVPNGYPIGKLCAEDPLSVSRKFSKKFHDFFEVVIIKGEILGKVDQFFGRKSTKCVAPLITMCFCGSTKHL